MCRFPRPTSSSKGNPLSESKIEEIGEQDKMPEATFDPSKFVVGKYRHLQVISLEAQVPASVKAHEEPISLGYGHPCESAQAISRLHLEVAESSGKVTILREEMKNSNKVPLGKSLAYGEMEGMPELWNDVIKFMAQMDMTPKYTAWGLNPTLGRNNAFHRVVQCIIDTDEVVLVPEFIDAQLLNQLAEVGAQVVPYKVDPVHGTDVAYLKKMLSSWNSEFPSWNKPKLFYTIPCGSPQSGATDAADTMQSVYKLCESFDMMILADEAFSHISLTGSGSEASYRQELIPSYLSLDTVGRVIKIDSFSKCFAPGIRAGYIIAHEALTKPLTTYAEIVNDFPPGPSQALINHTIVHMGGWLPWLTRLSAKYNARKTLLFEKLAGVAEQSNFQLIEPKFGFHVALKPSCDAREFQQRCLVSEGLTIGIGESLIDTASDLLIISLCNGSDEEFEEAVERLSIVIASS